MRNSDGSYRFEVDRFELRTIKRALCETGQFFMTGTYSVYCPTIKTKWVDKDRLIPWYGASMLPGEIAKHELKAAFPELKRVGWSPKSVKLFSHRFPAYCQAEHKGEFVYVDLIGAYLQIYERLWLDMAYPGGTGNLDLSGVAYRLKDCKPARNAVIGIIRSRKINGVKGFSSFALSSRNPYLSPHLWAFIMTWLNEVALVARSFGAVYVMMDGYFFPMSGGWSAFCDWLDERGIKYRQIASDGHILGWGSWSMSQIKTTKPYVKGARGRVNFVKQYCGPTTALTFWQRSLDWRATR